MQGAYLSPSMAFSFLRSPYLISAGLILVLTETATWARKAVGFPRSFLNKFVAFNDYAILSFQPPFQVDCPLLRGSRVFFRAIPALVNLLGHELGGGEGMEPVPSERARYSYSFYPILVVFHDKYFSICCLNLVSL